MKWTRRDFLKSTVFTVTIGTLGGAVKHSALGQEAVAAPDLATAAEAVAADASGKKWFRGNLHMHSQWSDGKVMPECAVHWYKSRGYHFVCLSDHNLIQTHDLKLSSKRGGDFSSELPAFEGEDSFWKVIFPKGDKGVLSQEMVDQAIQLFGADTVRTKKVGERTFVRLKPFDELERQFNEAGRFLMIPGYEQTGNSQNKHAVHMNFINVRETFPYIKGPTPLETIQQNLRAGLEKYTAEPFLFTVNHPMWRYYDISPQTLIELPEVRFVELNNTGIAREFQRHPKGWNPEKFLDVVNAYRAVHEQPILWFTGTDDRHDYSADFSKKGWSMVRADELSIPALLQAILAGDLYTTNGITLEDVQFQNGTLKVRVAAPEKGTCRIQFIGTKKGYDPNPQKLLVKKSAHNPKREIDIYSDGIGVVLSEVDGLEGSYTLQADDLYVRAKVVRNEPGREVAAWTQVYR